MLVLSRFGEVQCIEHGSSQQVCGTVCCSAVQYGAVRCGKLR